MVALERLANSSPSPPKAVESLHEMTHRTPEAVESCDDHHIDAPGLHLGHQLIEGRSPLLGARDPRVDELAHVRPLPRPAVVAEIAKLVVACLVAGAHTGVDGDPLHRAPPSTPS